MGRPKKPTPSALDTPVSILEPRINAANRTTDVGGYNIPVTSTMTALLWGFANHPSHTAKEYYFWRIADLWWNHPELPRKMFERNPWSELVIKECICNRYLAVGGAAGGSKSHTLAGYAIVSWAARPAYTSVLMTSTSLGMARKRIWGSTMDLLSVIEGLPIAIRDSIGSASYIDPKGNIRDTSGITLIAAERSRTREAIGKLIGIHQRHVILIGDELGELSPAITQAAMSNLSKNPTFEYKGLSNPASRFDAFGEWATPKDGWESINTDLDDEWVTKWGGKYIRLDGERSPNILAGHTLYPYLPTQEKIDDDKAFLGENSRGYYRMVRAVFFDSDEAEGVYGESEILQSGSMNKVEFVGSTTRLAACDPAFTNGGDRTVIWFGTLGYDTEGQFTLRFDEALFLSDDATNKAVPRTYQIVNQIKDACIKRGVSPENCAVDATGAGAPFCDVLAGEWSRNILRVQFGGKASDRRVSANSRLTGEELYTNRVSELWFVGKEFLRTKQLSGITTDLAKEMCSRRYDMIKSGNLRVKIESKIELKARMGASPDLADGAFILLDLARQKHGLVAVDLAADGKAKLPKWAIPTSAKTMADLDVVTRSAHSQLMGD